MRQLLYKEWKLAAHPTTVLFLFLSALMLVPNYPYLVTFFYTSLGVFFLCLNGRENHDLLYTMLLPVRKGDIVRARMGFVVLVELAQLILAVPFALLRSRMPIPGNQVGMDANLALFGFAFVMMGLFNAVFFTCYYRDPNRVGAAYLWSNAVMWPYLIVVEVCAHAVPFVREVLDTPDPQHLGAKAGVFFLGALIYGALTWVTEKRAIAKLEKLDI